MRLLAAGQGRPVTERTGSLQLYSKDAASDCWEPGGRYEVPGFLRTLLQCLLRCKLYYNCVGTTYVTEGFPKYLYKAIFCFSEQ